MQIFFTDARTFMRTRFLFAGLKALPAAGSPGAAFKPFFPSAP
jgi:hypothetical protein